MVLCQRPGSLSPLKGKPCARAPGQHCIGRAALALALPSSVLGLAHSSRVTAKVGAGPSFLAQVPVVLGSNPISLAGLSPAVSPAFCLV